MRSGFPLLYLVIIIYAFLHIWAGRSHWNRSTKWERCAIQSGCRRLLLKKTWNEHGDSDIVVTSLREAFHFIKNVAHNAAALKLCLTLPVWNSNLLMDFLSYHQPFSTNHTVICLKQLVDLFHTRPLILYYRSIWTTLCGCERARHVSVISESAPVFDLFLKNSSGKSVKLLVKREIGRASCRERV